MRRALSAALSLFFIVLCIQVFMWETHGTVHAQQRLAGEPFRCTVTVSTATAITAVGGSCVAPTGNKSIYITDILFSVNSAGVAADSYPTLKYGTGGTCGTGTTVFWSAMTAAAVQNTIIDNRTTAIKIPDGNEICWITTTAGSKSLVIGGFIGDGL